MTAENQVDPLISGHGPERHGHVLSKAHMSYSNDEVAFFCSTKVGRDSSGNLGRFLYITAGQMLAVRWPVARYLSAARWQLVVIIRGGCHIRPGESKESYLVSSNLFDDILTSLG